MALRIEFDELTSFKRSCDDKSVLWNTSVEALVSSTATLVEMDDFRGAAATGIKSYLAEVHYTVIWALMDILAEFSVKLLLYKDGYNQIDEALHAKFSENVLNDILRFFQGSQYEFDDSHLRLQQTADSISDIMYAPMPSSYSVTNDYDTVLRDQNRLKEELLNHESSHYANDFTNLDQLMANLETFISEALCVDRNTMNLYQSGAVAQSLAFCNLIQNLQTTEAQWQSMGEQLQAVYNREQVRLEAEQRVEDGKFQIFTSILEIAGGVLTIVVSVGAIVVSCGAATPLAVVGIIGGVGMIVHGSSNLQEGIEMVNLGGAGNMADSPRSWLRDSVMGPVFGEDNKQLAFDIFGYASAIMGVVGSAGASAWASATKVGATASSQILRAVLVEEAKVGVSAIGGILGGKGSGWVATNVFGVDENTARYVEVIGGIAAGAATYRGVNALDKHFNWNGLNPPKSVDLSNYSNTELPATGSDLHPNVPEWTDGSPAEGILKIGEQEIPLRSGVNGPGEYLQTLPGGKGSGLNAQIPSHVEGHVAAIMHQEGLTSAELFINKPPCQTGAMCRYNLHKILPPGSSLTVHFLNIDGSISTWLFTAGIPKWVVVL